jgi:hypothetical protein
MKANISCIISLVSFILLITGMPAAGQPESKDQLLKFYERCITKKIANCWAKTDLRNSRSVNLRQRADLATKKLVFFTANKNMLINEMVDQEIGQKHYKVDYYLNKRFSEMVK